MTLAYLGPAAPFGNFPKASIFSNNYESTKACGPESGTRAGLPNPSLPGAADQAAADLSVVGPEQRRAHQHQQPDRRQRAESREQHGHGVSPPVFIVIAAMLARPGAKITSRWHDIPGQLGTTTGPEPRCGVC